MSGTGWYSTTIPNRILLYYLPACTLRLPHTHSHEPLKRHLEESTDHGIQPRLQYSESSRRREAHQSIHILRCSFLSVQRPGMARQVSRAMDPPGNDHRCPTGQFRPECRTSTTTGRIRGCINTYRCVSNLAFFPTLSLTSVSSNWLAGNDVPNPLQSKVRNAASGIPPSGPVDPDRLQHYHELARCPIHHGKFCRTRC